MGKRGKMSSEPFQVSIRWEFMEHTPFIVSWSEMQSVVVVVVGIAGWLATHLHISPTEAVIQPFEFRSQSFRSLYSQISPPCDISESVADNLSRSGRGWVN